jgi:hypothetical protein
MDALSRKKILKWASGRDTEQLECRVGRHWWPSITSDKTEIEYDPKRKVYLLIGYCQRGCGAKHEHPRAKGTGIVSEHARIVYPDGYLYDGNAGGEGVPMNSEARGVIAAELLRRKIEG